MNDYFNLSDLPVLSPKRCTMQASSFDRKSDNADFGQFLYEDADGAMVLFDERCGGCIKSIWAAIVTDETELSFYFDGSDLPRYTATLRGFFTGAVPELSGAANTLEERGHYDGADCVAGNCFIPIRYESSLKITARGKTDFYYHIMYERISEDAPEITRTKALDAAFDGKRTPPDGREISLDCTLKNGYNTVWTDTAAGVVTEFTVTAAADTDLSDIQLDISFDGEPVSQVAVPLNYLFAQPFGFTPVKTLAAEASEKDGRITMSCYLPMPYFKSAGICLVNWSGAPVALSLRLRVAENGYDERSCGYFHADYRKGLTELFGDWLIGEFPGRGNIVGVVQTCIGGQYCEGNEHFYINGALTPQINGTGTEDFYLACYWPNLKFDSPCGGCVNDVYLSNGGTLEGSFKSPAGYYRYLHDMPISFINGIKLAIQHGAVGQTYSDYSSACFSYRRNDSLLEETDFISLASSASRAMHGYTAEAAEPFTLSSVAERERRTPPMTRTGFSHKRPFSFTVASDEDNDGVYLRRLYDQRTSPQTGRVTVDGEPAGLWHNAGKNDFAAFADSDFYIPARLTRGKSSLKIEITPLSGFTDFEYRVFSEKKL